MKNKIIISIVLFGMILSSSAQEISRSVVSTSGKYEENSGYSLSSTVGEPMTKTFSNSGYTLTQGFQQPDGDCQSQDITINSGWNMISSYVLPDEPDMAQVFGDISGDILLVKNTLGQTYIPSFAINNIGDWDVIKGYKVKASANTILKVGCTQVDPLTTSISLGAGWNIFAYLRMAPMDIATALASIDADILIVKDVFGNTYIPSFAINNIGDMKPGQGYKAKMSNAVSLTYPAN